jgi:hypothetical protein
MEKQTVRLMLKSIKGILAASLIALFTTINTDASAQMGRVESGEDIFGFRAHPQQLTVGIGGGVNTNMAWGAYNPMGSSDASFSKGNYHTPNFHVGMELPTGLSNFSLVPRVTYNDLSSVLDDNGDGQTIDQGSQVAYAYRTIGVDGLVKYSVTDNLHLLGGGNISGSVKRSFSTGTTTVESASASQSEMPGSPEYLISAIGGVGYDIPLTMDSRIMLTPEVSYNVPLANLAQGDRDGDLRVNTLSSKITLKFALDK